ncbi:ectonucleotide pyrophosphatase/phosphodiesterase [Winogradskyella psychrotolerans]|uniref:alkaline phosphatase family protein n=1 Tax=Winogradskyella psychrotolerans TaxID=1344585 RepID=UPI001C072F4A|nr:ectonucleotide pyrophosphatase/phosphodiesterase [Winogradskyella psychrotolerans]MBU2929631.1 ectonucleotide pyrophosphatase/phosphodiesterase [Winogradskyella psychrotolerans]
MKQGTLLLISMFIIVMMLLNSCNIKIINSPGSITKTDVSVVEKTPYLLLISLDGFRWDYVEKYNPPNLSSFIKSGVKSASLIPSFPTKTFPNHYTIATGLYPDKHGLIGNIFYDYNKETLFNKRNPKMAEDGSFYGGSPIWVEANKAGIVTASYFFVGTEAKIQGIRPTYYYKFDNNVENEQRVNQTLDWLNLEETNRPHLITLYFGDMDKVGHTYGTRDEDKLKTALFELDKNLGDLFKGISETNLPVNIIIVSDHGMGDQSTHNIIPIDSIENDDLFMTIENGTIVNIHPKKAIEIDTVLQYLRLKEHNFKAYRTENTPGFEYIPTNKNWGAIQLIPDFGYHFWNQRRKDALIEDGVTTFGVHGYDSKYKEMHGIFYANGPAFKDGYEIHSIKNIHIYPLMCEILGLKIPESIDGDIKEIKSILKENN